MANIESSAGKGGGVFLDTEVSGAHLARKSSAARGETSRLNFAELRVLDFAVCEKVFYTEVSRAHLARKSSAARGETSRLNFAELCVFKSHLLLKLTK